MVFYLFGRDFVLWTFFFGELTALGLDAFSAIMIDCVSDMRLDTRTWVLLYTQFYNHTFSFFAWRPNACRACEAIGLATSYFTDGFVFWSISFARRSTFYGKRLLAGTIYHLRKIWMDFFYFYSNIGHLWQVLAIFYSVSVRFRLGYFVVSKWFTSNFVDMPVDAARVGLWFWWHEAGRTFSVHDQLSCDHWFDKSVQWCMITVSSQRIVGVIKALTLNESLTTELHHRIRLKSLPFRIRLVWGEMGCSDMVERAKLDHLNLHGVTFTCRAGQLLARQIYITGLGSRFQHAAQGHGMMYDCWDWLLDWGILLVLLKRTKEAHFTAN